MSPNDLSDLIELLDHCDAAMTAASQHVWDENMDLAIALNQRATRCRVKVAELNSQMRWDYAVSSNTGSSVEGKSGAAECSAKQRKVRSDAHGRNPDLKIAAVRSLARKWGAEQAIVIAIDGCGRAQMVTYGETRALFGCAKVLGDAAFNAIKGVVAAIESQAAQTDTGGLR